MPWFCVSIKCFKIKNSVHLTTSLHIKNPVDNVQTPSCVRAACELSNLRPLARNLEMHSVAKGETAE